MMAKHYDKQFKLDAVQYYHDHKNLGLQGCATNLGISQQTLSRWQKDCVKQVILKAVVPVTMLLMKQNRIMVLLKSSKNYVNQEKSSLNVPLVSI